MKTAKYRYDKDGWMYKNNKRLRKWFSHVSTEDGSYRVKVWGPILRDVVGLEHRCKQIIDCRDRFMAKQYRPMFDLMKAASQAHAKPTHKFGGDKKWWLYRATERGIGFDWIDEPESRINHAIGQKFYRLDSKMVRYNGYVHIVKTALSYSINKMLDRDYKPNRAGTTMKLTINGRIFWYVTTQYQHCVGWKKISWPYSALDDIIEVNLNA